jgi:glutathione S-transferase
MIPGAIRAVMAPIARRGVRRQLMGHGMGLHSPQEIHAIGQRDIGAVADFLGDKQYLMGDSPTQIDAVAYGVLANIMRVPIESPVKDAALRRRNLVDFIERMRERYFAVGAQS